MRTIFLVTLAFGCAFAARPYIWSNDTCPEEVDIHESYIVGGEEAPEGLFPYMLSVSSESKNEYFCGASILAKNWALTTASCCADFRGEKFYLRSGTNSKTKDGKIHKMEKYIIHEDFMPGSFWKNDICLIKVRDPFVYGPKVQQVILPKQYMIVKDGELLNITGWGVIKPHTEKPDKLQWGKNFVALSSARCRDKTELEHESYLCAVGGVEGRGACNGDSGSPLVKNGVLFGMSSWLFLPCGCGKPEFYARVSTFVDWIKEELGPDASELKILK